MVNDKININREDNLNKLKKVKKTKTISKEKEDYSWVKDIFAKASKEVKSWPAWMQQPEMRNIYNTEKDK